MGSIQRPFPALGGWGGFMGTRAMRRVLWGLGVIVGSGSAAVHGQSTPPALPEGAEKETVQRACGTCHGLETVANAGHNRQEWTSVVNMMVNQGAPVPKNQIAGVTD